jgi:hypothetical protein
MNSNNPLKCNLGRIQPKQIDAEKLKREGWNNDGILIIKIDDKRLSWPEKELIKQIGDKIYNNKTNNKNGEKYAK